MNILHLDYDDFDNQYAGGGQAKATFEINKRLSKNNKIVVITGNYPGAKNLNKNGIKYIRVGFGNYGATVSIISYWLLAPLKAWRIQNDFDIVVEFFTAPFSASITPFILKKPLVACPTFFDAKELSKKYNIPFHIIEEIGVKKYKIFIALTTSIKDKILRLNPAAKVVVIPRGVEREYLDIKGNESNYILYLGRVDMHQKGLDLLLKSWSYVSKKHPNLDLIIAGGGKKDDEHALKNMLIKHKITSSVIRKGVVRGEEKIKLLANSICIANPSRWETFGNSALESLAAGRPLVCFDISGYRWIPDKISLKVEKFNTDLLSKTFMKVLSNKRMRASVGKKAREFAKKFDWDQVARKYISLYSVSIK